MLVVVAAVVGGIGKGEKSHACHLAGEWKTFHFTTTTAAECEPEV